MGFLLALSCVFIIYGTLYPFNFTAGFNEGNALSLLISSVHHRAGRGDAIANIILFLPFGFFTMQRILQRAPRPMRLILIFAAGATFSFGIECAQSWLPDRTVSIYDLALNTAGALFGAALGWKDWRGKIPGLNAKERQTAIFPIMLLGAWLGSQLLSYVPILDVQNVKDALKPLIFGSFVPLDALRNFIVAMVVCRLAWTLTTPGRLRTALMFLPLGVIFLKPFFLDGSISQAGIIGALFGIAVWWFALSRTSRNTVILAFLLMSQIVIQGLAPYNFSTNPGHFSIIPFIGFINGSMIINILQFMEKVFYYGALVWFLVKTGLSLRISLSISVVMLTGIELTQIFLPGRVSEITDPLLAVILGIFLYFLDLCRESPDTPPSV